MAGVLAVLLGLAMAAPPCSAADAAVPAAPSAKTLRAATDARLASLDTSKGVQFAQAGGAAGSGESSSFFKSKKGVLAGILMVGGMAWMIASRQSDDVVHSPAR